MWQDFGFAAGAIVLILALLPAVWRRQIPPLATTLWTGGVLSFFTVLYATLDLPFAAVTTGITAVLWHIQTVQNLRHA